MLELCKLKAEGMRLEMISLPVRLHNVAQAMRSSVHPGREAPMMQTSRFVPDA